MPMGYAQPQYGPPKQAMDIGQMLRKMFLIIMVLVGALFLLIARILLTYQSTEIDLVRAGTLLQALGALIMAIPAVVWALGSKRTTDMQNFGLLVFAAILIAYMV